MASVNVRALPSPLARLGAAAWAGVLAALLSAACLSSSEGRAEPEARAEPLKVVTTFTVIRDIAQNVAGTAATGDALPMAARPMASLAEVVDLVTFARSDVLDLRHSGISGQTIVDDCRRWADQVVAVADDLLDQRHKLWRYFTAYD